MSVQSRIKSNQRGTAVTAVTGAAPQTVAGNAFPMFSAEPFTVSALAYTKATVNTLTLTGKWQGRNIASGTWLDVYTANSAAITTGRLASTARSSRRGSPRPARWLPSPPPSGPADSRRAWPCVRHRR